jgi:hypothetical protein
VFFVLVLLRFLRVRPEVAGLIDASFVSVTCLDSVLVSMFCLESVSVVCSDCFRSSCSIS